MHVHWSSRRLGLTLVLAVCIALLWVLALRDATSTQPGRAPDVAAPTLTAVGHRTYTFTLHIPSPEVPWRAGERLVFDWVPQFTSFSLSDRPNPVQCTVVLYGPFPTSAAAQQQLAGPGTPPSVPAVAPALAPPPLLVDDWTSQPTTMVLTLPATLAPGYYVLLDREVSVGGESGGVNIVSVA